MKVPELIWSNTCAHWTAYDKFSLLLILSIH